MFVMLINWQDLWSKISTFGKTISLKILESIAIFAVGYLVIRLLINFFKKILTKTKTPKVSYSFIINVLRIVLYLLLLIIICQILGIPTTGLIAIISAAGLALSLALENSLANLANGIVIISTRPFNEGDYISINSVEGTISEIKLLHTIINTTDNKKISIPNSQIINNELVNYSANPNRKVIFDFNIDYKSDVNKAKQIILNVMQNCSLVLQEPSCFCALKSLNQSSITLNAYCWCNNNNYWDVYYFVLDNVFNEFKKNNIVIPFNQLDVTIKTDNNYKNLNS